MEQQKLVALLQDMDLGEKIGQLLQLSNNFYEEEAVITGPAMQLGIEEKEIFQAGSVLSVFGVEKVKSIQKTYMEKQPHHIPLLFMADIINGYKTIFPIPLAQGCSFDPKMVNECAKIAAKEAAISGLHVTFSPMADLVRDARWGRVMESTGEDSFLNEQMTAAMVEGYQGGKRGTELANKGSIAACVKHFAAYGAAEAGRDYNTVELSERTLREDYLPAYKAGVDAGCALMMTSFNTLNHVPATGNKWLMRDILRSEMEFKGVLISDWAAIEELIYHGIASNKEEASKLAMEAGVDIDMVSGCYVNHIAKLIEDNSISEQLLNESVMRILQLKNALGLFENPYKDADEIESKKMILCAEHREKARTAAAETMVLLKNEGRILPLSKERRIAFIGPYVEEERLYGAWSLLGDEQDTVTVKAGIERAYNGKGDKTVFCKGSSLLDPDEILYGFQGIVENRNEQSNETLITDAIKAAETADMVVFFLGEHAYHSGEGGSRGDITLPNCQMHLFREICKVSDNVVTVIFAGRPLDLREIEKNSKAILYAWFPGSEGGNAIGEILFGEKSPSAKLSMSFPYSVGQIPIYYGGLSTGRTFNGKKENRFQSIYQDMPNEPLYPFGYGITYTTFEYSAVSLDKNILQKRDLSNHENTVDSIEASVTLTNCGERMGVETVQLYLCDVSGSVSRPTRRLKGFQKVRLQPGEKKKVVFEITEKMLRFYDIDMNYVSEAGKFRIFIGEDSKTMNGSEFVLA